MARSSNKSAGGGFALLILAAVAYAAWQFISNNPWIASGTVAALVALYLIYLFATNAATDRALQARVDALTLKYRNSEIVNKILAGDLWVGQAESQLSDSIGAPDDIDTKVMKSKTRTVWKYHETRRGSYALRVTLDDGHVAGWDDKR